MRVMPSAPEPDRIEQLLRGTFEDFVARRIAYYDDPRLLPKLLDRNLLLFALRGTRDVSEFVDAALAAHEAASEETMLGNAWQAAIAEIVPHAVGGGDLRMERDGELWIVQLKMSPKQNSSAMAQDIRILRNKVLSERDHHPGRHGVKAMVAFLTGDSQSRWVTHRSRSPANADIDGFQYQVMAGEAFFSWIGVKHDPIGLLRELHTMPELVRQARAKGTARLKDELGALLADQGRPDSMLSIMELAEHSG